MSCAHVFALQTLQNTPVNEDSAANQNIAFQKLKQNMARHKSAKEVCLECMYFFRHCHTCVNTQAMVVRHNAELSAHHSRMHALSIG